MTVHEAINDLKEIFSEHELDLPYQDTLKVLNIAIESMEKQKPKKPTFKEGFIGFYECECGGLVEKSMSYCCECGQAIDWGEEDD